MNAHAYAQGNQIHLGSGQEKHLPHEAWHVVQQKQGRVKPTIQLKSGTYVNDNDGLENEATTMGERAKNSTNTPNSIAQRINDNSNTVVQRVTSLGDFINAVAEYVRQLERYSHQGYPEHGKRTRGDVQGSRQSVIDLFNDMSKSDQQKIQQGNFNTDGYTSYNDEQIDPNLIKFHAQNLQMEPLASVSFDKSVSGYHQQYTQPEIEDEKAGANRNYATFYYEIGYSYNFMGREETGLCLKGSAATRSGKSKKQAPIKAPAQKGFQQHQVPVNDDKDIVVDTFEDSHDRSYDSEVAFFDDISRQLISIYQGLRLKGHAHPKFNGGIKVFTDRATCNSCTAMAMKFQSDWGIPVHVIHGGVNDGKGYSGI
jgi:hypothetical protein